jgi:predicted ester cyclase
MEKEQVKNTALAVSLAILEARWNDLDNLLDDNFTYTGDGFVFTKDEYIGFMQDMKAAFSDLKMEFPHIVVDGDTASIRFISTAVNTGKFMGAPANKKHLEINGIFIRKVKDGKVMQEWQTTDLLGVMKQIGFGALFGYSLFVGLFNVQQPRPVRKK